MDKNWHPISNSLLNIYEQHGILAHFEQDETYLQNAFEQTEKLWDEQFEKINDLKVVMISEAPLFGEKQTYIYNMDSKPTVFFYYQDLEAFPTYDSTRRPPKSISAKKLTMFEHFTKNGFMVLDIFPLALNSKDTAINFQRMSKNLYNQLLTATTDSYLIPKLKRCLKKSQKPLCLAYRYKRLFSKTEFHVERILKSGFLEREFILTTINGTNISLDRKKLATLLTAPN